MRRRRQTARRSAAGCGSAAEGHRGRRRAGGRRRGGQSAKSVSSRLPVSRAMSIVCAEPTRSQQQCVQPELRRRAALQGSSHASPPRSARCRVSRESQSTSSDTAAHASSRRLSAAAAVALGIELTHAGARASARCCASIVSGAGCPASSAHTRAPPRRPRARRRRAALRRASHRGRADEPRARSRVELQLAPAGLARAAAG